MKRACLLLALALPFAPSAYAACQPGSGATDIGSATAASGTAAAWSGWGLDQSNSRHVADAGLSAQDVPGLELKWAFGFADARSVMGQPVVLGDQVLIGVNTGAVYSLDAESGCVHWTFTADEGVRTSPIIADIGGVPTVFFGDVGAQFYAVDFETGALRWKAEVDAHPAAKLTGSPQFLRMGNETDSPDRLFIPVSSGEEGAAGNPEYRCCTFRGSVVALNAGNGEQIWKTYTIADAPAATGTGTFGPSGAAIWSAPTIDVERGLLYVATGDAYSAPADPASDAVIAMELGTGNIRWIQQDTADDIWTVACMRPGAPDDCGPDHDFGAPPILVTVADRQLLIAGQKSGNVWAHDPDTGAVVWRSPLVEDTTQFGGKIIWGGAADQSQAYFGLGSGGIGAVRLQDGELQWFTALSPQITERARYTGHDGPVTVSSDVIFSGGWDGILRALSTTTGTVIWEYDTVRSFETVNGVAASGGSMGAAGPVVAGGKLFVPSGYPGVKNGMPGNVLLVFAAGE